ncbi:MAG: hypothetical protein FWD32_00105 [Firmicutes bacterium]|nr:hypothetical protein [Bacillota bacterium]
MKIYHVSKTTDLKFIEPRISTHSKPWVYAINNLTTALIFGAQKDDFDFILGINKKGQTVLEETYPNAFEIIYKEKACSIYELENSGFCEDKTSWKAEIVSENKTKVIRETKINDLKSVLENEIKKGNLVLNKFENTKEYKTKVSKHITDRLIRFNILDKEIRPSIQEHFGEIIKQLQKIRSGDYLT